MAVEDSMRNRPPQTFMDLYRAVDGSVRLIEHTIAGLALRQAQDFTFRLSAGEATYLACVDIADYDDTRDEGARMLDNADVQALQGFEARRRADLLREEYVSSALY